MSVYFCQPPVRSAYISLTYLSIPALVCLIWKCKIGWANYSFHWSHRILSQDHKQAVERLECTTASERTSQCAGFESYQLSMSANVRRKFFWPCPSLIVTLTSGTSALWECLYGMLYIKATTPKRIPVYCSKRHVHCRLMGKAMTLPAGTTVTGHYQSQIMLSNSQLSAILPTASNFYCKQIESMIFTFSLSFTSVPRLVPSQGTRYPCQLFTPYSHQGRCLFQLQGRQPEESVPL